MWVGAGLDHTPRSSSRGLEYLGQARSGSGPGAFWTVAKNHEPTGVRIMNMYVCRVTEKKDSGSLGTILLCPVEACSNWKWTPSVGQRGMHFKVGFHGSSCCQRYRRDCVVGLAWGEIGESRMGPSGHYSILHPIPSIAKSSWRYRQNGYGRPPAPEAQLPRSQALDPIPWSGLQMVPSLT